MTHRLAQWLSISIVALSTIACGNPAMHADGSTDGRDATGTDVVRPDDTTGIDVQMGDDVIVGEDVVTPDAVVCPSGRLSCGGVCIDPTSDPQNCGACGTACASGSSCVGSTCMVGCPAPRMMCGAPATCVDTTSDALNCGRCGNLCAGGTVCLNGLCGCAPGQTSCNGSCADTQNDNNNCGTCGHACGAGQACSMGTCAIACTAPMSPCTVGGTMQCVNLQSDMLNCGACGNLCAGGTVCNAGSCSCATGQMFCGDRCIDVQTDRNNCGACGNTCAAGIPCNGGVCGCVAPFRMCSAACVNTNSDNTNCGQCGNICAGGTVCNNGLCGCPAGQSFCGGACINTQTDRNNCGSCGNVCSLALSCSAGSCACPAGRSLCGSSCVLLTSDNANCGACGNTCAGGTTCQSGSCACPPGTSFCNGTCVNTQSNPANCGACGVVCSAGSSCFAGTCTAATGPMVVCPADSTIDAGMNTTLTVTAASPGRTITSYAWTTPTAPPGGSAAAVWTPMGRNVASEVFNPGVVGTYTVHVVVTDSAGASASCDTHVTAMSHGIRVELLWDGPGDVDLHVHNGVTTSPWFTTPNDCYYANPDATWGAVLDLDSIDGPGPELTHIDTPVSGMTYTMAAHAYSMTSAGRTATMRVYCGRTTTPAIVRTSHPFVAPASGNSSANDFWRAASITWNAAPPCTATPIDTYTTSMSASTTF